MRKAKKRACTLAMLATVFCLTLTGCNDVEGKEIEVTNTTERITETTATTEKETEPTTEPQIEYNHVNTLIGYAHPTTVSVCLQLLCMQVCELEAITAMEGPEWSEIQSLSDLYSAVNEKEVALYHRLFCSHGLTLQEVLNLYEENDFTPMIVMNEFTREYFILKGAYYSKEDENFFAELFIYDKTSNGYSEAFTDFMNNRSKVSVTVEKLNSETGEVEYTEECEMDALFEVMYLGILAQ